MVLADQIKRRRSQILKLIKNQLSDARIEAIYNKLKLMKRMAYGKRVLIDDWHCHRLHALIEIV